MICLKVHDLPKSSWPAKKREGMLCVGLLMLATASRYIYCQHHRGIYILPIASRYFYCSANTTDNTLKVHCYHPLISNFFNFQFKTNPTTNYFQEQTFPQQSPDWPNSNAAIRDKHGRLYSFAAIYDGSNIFQTNTNHSPCESINDFHIWLPL